MRKTSIIKTLKKELDTLGKRSTGKSGHSKGLAVTPPSLGRKNGWTISALSQEHATHHIASLHTSQLAAPLSSLPRYSEINRLLRENKALIYQNISEHPWGRKLTSLVSEAPRKDIYSNSGMSTSQRIIFRKKAYKSGNILLRSKFFLSGKEICGLIVIEHGLLELEYASASATGLEMLQEYTKDFKKIGAKCLGEDR